MVSATHTGGACGSVLGSYLPCFGVGNSAGLSCGSGIGEEKGCVLCRGLTLCQMLPEVSELY